jgi:hypothetical protein
MTALAILSGVLLILITGFLFAPVSLYVDTIQGCYEVSQAPAFRFHIVIKDGEIVPRLQLAGINVPLQSKTNPVKRTKKKPEKKSGFRRSLAAWRFLIERSLKSFDVKQAVVDLDTDDVVLNAQLSPLFFLASRGPLQLRTNFNGRVYFHLEARNRPARLLWIFLQFLIKK